MSIIVGNVSFKSEGHELFGRIYRPNDQGKLPAVAICHGYPGDTKNMDLAEELALEGIAVLVFYYRGAWGSGGTYRLINLEPSTRDAVSYLRSLPFVDPSKVGLVSHSMGAVPLTRRMSLDPTLKAGVLIAPAADLSLLAADERLEMVVPVFMKMAEGKLRGLEVGQLRADLKRVMEEQNPVDVVREVKAPVMVVVGSDDEVTPPEACRALYEAANEPKRWLQIEGADHLFSEHRIPMINAVLSWLKENL